MYIHYFHLIRVKLRRHLDQLISISPRNLSSGIVDGGELEKWRKFLEMAHVRSLIQPMIKKIHVTVPNPSNFPRLKSFESYGSLTTNSSERLLIQVSAFSIS